MVVHVLKPVATKASARAGEDGTEISLIECSLHRAIRPDERRTFDSGIVAGTGDEGGASGASWHGIQIRKAAKARIRIGERMIDPLIL
jgi:hypothetical protein